LIAAAADADIGIMPARQRQHIDIISSADGDYSIAPAKEGEPDPSVPSSTPAKAFAKTKPGKTEAARGQRRPWVGIHFECCGVYARVYREPDASCYVGYCPRCQRRVTLRVGPDGVSARFFRASPL